MRNYNTKNYLRELKINSLRFSIFFANYLLRSDQRFYGQAVTGDLADHEVERISLTNRAIDEFRQTGQRLRNRFYSVSFRVTLGGFLFGCEMAISFTRGGTLVQISQEVGRGFN